MSVYVSDGLVVSDENVEELAETLPFLGQGATRRVYDLGDVVLKVTYNYGHTVGHCTDEASVWEQVKDSEWSEYFAPVLASGDSWLIMAKADTDEGIPWDELQTLERKLNSLGIGDLHEQNVGYIGDRLVAIDYSFNRAGRLVLTSIPATCECGEHDCKDCYPDGCECCCEAHNWEGCETFQGCRKEQCDECYVTAVHHWQETFGFLQGVVRNQPNGIGQVMHWEHFHACHAHKPSHIREIRKEIPGQRGFLIDRNEMFLPWWSERL